MRYSSLNLISKLKLLFFYILNLGVENSKLNRQNLKIVKLCNAIHLLIATLLLLVGFAFLMVGLKALFLVDLLWFLINLFCLVLNHQRKFETSKSVFLISIHLYTLFTSFILNLKELSVSILLLSVTIPLFIFKRTDYLKIFVCYALAIANYLVLKNSAFAYEFGINYSANTIKMIEFCGFSFSAFCLITIIFSQNLISAQNEYHMLREIRQRKKVEKSLAEAKKLSDKSSLVKIDFLTTISYHIRTPLNAILGLSNLLILESPKKSQFSKLSTLKSSTDSLIRLIDNLLDFNKIESGDINVYDNDFQIRELMENIYKSYYLKAEEKGNKILMTIDPSIPNKLIGDEIKLSQIISNLVSNAIKFTEKGTVKIELKVKKESNGFVNLLISISDTGIGIAKEKVKYIFENFATNLAVNGRNYTTSGSGLGLSISKRLAEVLGTDINVESNLGKGSKFYFNVNLKLFEESKSLEMVEDVPTKLKNLNNIKILLVDDNNLNLLVAETFLKRWNAKVDTAEDGITAVELAKNTVYDIILMDLQLPQINGFEASKQIRVFNPDVAILALTAENYGFANQNFALLGIDDMLLKPFYPADLYNKIETLIGEKIKIKNKGLD